jgi:hypothetical protein
MVWVLALLALLATPFDEPFLGFLLALGDQMVGLGSLALTALALVTVGGGLLAYTVVEARIRQFDDASTMAMGAALMGSGSLVAGVWTASSALFVGGGLVGVGMSLSWLAVEHRQLTLRPGQQGATFAIIGAVQSLGFLVPAAVGVLVDRTGLRTGVTAHAGLAAGMLVLSLAMTHRRSA